MVKEVKIDNEIIILEDDYIPNKKEEEYMSKKQRAYFKRVLLDLSEKIIRDTERAKEQMSSYVMDEHSSDEADMSNIAEETIGRIREKDRQRRYLDRIKGVIKNIENDEFGYCEKSGEEIGIPRLLARPITRYSIETQEKMEEIESLNKLVKLNENHDDILNLQSDFIESHENDDEDDQD